MADILIRGMEMPTEQRIEVLIFKNGFVAYYDVYGHYLGQARATQLPAGHGRLIDADALDEAFTALRFADDWKIVHWGDRKNWCLHGSEIEKLIDNAPTIVPAEGGGEDG